VRDSQTDRQTDRHRHADHDFYSALHAYAVLTGINFFKNSLKIRKCIGVLKRLKTLNKNATIMLKVCTQSCIRAFEL